VQPRINDLETIPTHLHQSTSSFHHCRTASSVHGSLLLHAYLLQIPQRQHIAVHEPAYTVLDTALFIAVQATGLDGAGYAFLEAH